MPIIPPPILKSLAGLVALIIVGCIGYRVIEGWPWFDCLYMTVITLSTTGFGVDHANYLRQQRCHAELDSDPFNFWTEQI